MVDHAGQLVDDFFLALAAELRHEGQIHSGALPDGHGEGFTGGVHAGNGGMLLDGALGEHIRLALQIAVIVQHFQRTQQVIGAVI